MAKKRHLSRIAVMQVLFEREKRKNADAFEALDRDTGELGELDIAFARAMLDGILAKESEIRSIVQEHAPGWTLERMDPISRCMLMVGAYELLFGNDAPPAVVMDEAIEISKEYGTAESGKFVNGVLNAIAHRSLKS